MDDVVKTAVISAARYFLKKEIYGLKPKEMRIVAECYLNEVSPLECARKIQADSSIIRRMYLKLAYASMCAVLNY